MRWVQQQALAAAYQYLNAQNTPNTDARTEAIHNALAAAAAEGSGIPLVQDVIAKGLAGITGIRGQPISGKTFNNIVIPLRQVLEKAFEFEKIAQPLASVIGTRSVQLEMEEPNGRNIT